MLGTTPPSGRSRRGLGPRPLPARHPGRCLGADLVKDASSHLPPGSRAEQVAGAGHFLHLERPEEVNSLILDWLGPA
ncbi:alpha/beta fold hydrolase [Nonomuraea insulae]|uniref:Alpha/beta fold hydrolase n=1 Tax=Nonomuraea insulae TaxID=1616787 RepID=A0ABW1CS80_9ACTN